MCFFIIPGFLNQIPQKRVKCAIYTRIWAITNNIQTIFTRINNNDDKIKKKKKYFFFPFKNKHSPREFTAPHISWKTGKLKISIENIKIIRIQKIRKVNFYIYIQEIFFFSWGVKFIEHFYTFEIYWRADTWKKKN